MSCQEVVDKLYFYLDGEVLTPQERREIEDHLAQCLPCNKYYKFEERFWNYFRISSLDFPLPESFLNRVETVFTNL